MGFLLLGGSLFRVLNEVCCADSEWPRAGFLITNLRQEELSPVAKS